VTGFPPPKRIDRVVLASTKIKRITYTAVTFHNEDARRWLPLKNSPNASHGQQLSPADKQRLAGILWRDFGAMKSGERVTEIKELLSVSERSIQAWTKNARETEKKEQQDKAWDLWLDCYTEQGIADEMNIPRDTIHTWLVEKRKDADFNKPPGSTDKQPWGNIQHFDIWQFAKANGDSTYIHYARDFERLLRLLPRMKESSTRVASI
jgi:hypothetical protein